MALNEFLKLLQSIQIFEGLSDQVVLNLVSFCKETKVKKGEFLFKEGQTSDAVYILLEGKLKVSQGGSDIGFVSPREIVGEMGVFSGMSRSADVVACEDGQVLKLPQDDLKKFIQQDKDAGLVIYANVIKVMARHLRGRNFVLEAENLMDDYISLNSDD